MNSNISENIDAVNNNNNYEKVIPNIEFLIDLATDSFSYLVQDNTFIIFKSINDIFCMAYSNNNKSIIIFNLIYSQKITEIKNSHNNYITNFRYFLDIINNRDLILSISAPDNSIKIWNISSFECLLSIDKIYENGILSSGIILNNNNKNFIILINFNVWESEPIKIFDFNGKKIREINNTDDKTFLIEIYYDKKSSKNYFITGNWGYVKSFDFNKKALYKRYCDNDKSNHHNIVINQKEELIKLIESGGDGNIRIWNFHTGLLLNKINTNKIAIRSICLWNDEYLFVGFNEILKILGLKKGIIIKEINLPNYTINNIKKILLPKYNECLIFQGVKNEPIKLFIIKE